MINRILPAPLPIPCCSSLTEQQQRAAGGNPTLCSSSGSNCSSSYGDCSSYAELRHSSESIYLPTLVPT